MSRSYTVTLEDEDADLCEWLAANMERTPAQLIELLAKRTLLSALRDARRADEREGKQTEGLLQ